MNISGRMRAAERRRQPAQGDGANILDRDDGRTRGYYLERAYLLALLATFVPSVISYNDHKLPKQPVLYMKTPAGQLCWHLNPLHLWLFPHVPLVQPGDPRAIWDHSRKRDHFRRIRTLIGITCSVGTVRRARRTPNRRSAPLCPRRHAAAPVNSRPVGAG